MSNAELIDFRETAELHRRQLRRRRVRILLPILCALVMVATMLAIARYTYVSNRRDAVALGDELVRGLERRITAEVEEHLSPAAEMVRLASGIYASRMAWTSEIKVLEIFGLQALAVYPQFAAFHVGGSNGFFLMTLRMPDGAVHTKIIQRENEIPTISWTRRDTAGNTLRIETVDYDGYDPRERPWYIGAVETRALFWTDVYTFFTSQKPGVTAAIPVSGPDGGVAGVLSVDIKLEDLNRFLSDLHIGKNGRALIIDKQGALIASPQSYRATSPKGDSAAPLMVDQLGDPVLYRAYDRFRVEGHGIRHIEVDGRRYSSMASSLKPAVGQDWTIMIYVPEEDFVGFVKSNIQRALVLSLGVFALAGMMAVLLVFQSLKLERISWLLNRRKKQIKEQSMAFSDLTSIVSLSGPEDDDARNRLTEVVADAMGVRRVSGWRLAAGGDALSCRDCYDRESGGHTAGTVLNRSDFPKFFEALDAGDLIRVTQAAADPRTNELFRAYLAPLGCMALLVVPVAVAGGIGGAIFFEHDGTDRGWSQEDVHFGQSIANMLGLRARTESSPAVSGDAETRRRGRTAAGRQSGCPSGGLEGKPPPKPHLRSTGMGPARVDLLERQLKGRGLGREALGADVIAGVTVMAIYFTRPVPLAGPSSGDRSRAALDHLACRVEQTADDNGIAYLKMMGDRIICAAGLEAGSGGSPQRIAAAGLALQEYLMNFFAGLEAPMAFRIGIDTGTVFGSYTGCSRESYNLWGGAVSTAGKMADQGLDGAIHVTESAYGCLRDEFLFKLRGGFYVESVGEIRTYLLTGRL